jgi:hypothetical protein
VFGVGRFDAAYASYRRRPVEANNKPKLSQLRRLCIRRGALSDVC